MKIRRIAFCFGLLSVCTILMMGCKKNNVENVAEEKKLKVVEQFVDEFFTLNKNDRYAALIKVSYDNEDDKQGIHILSNEQQETYETYYQGFRSFATEECIAEMQSERLPVKYDKLAMEEGIRVAIQDIECKKILIVSTPLELSLKQMKCLMRQ